MKFFTANLNLSTDKTSNPTKLITLAKKIDRRQKKLNLPLEQITEQKNDRRRLFADIIEQIETKNFQQISLIEWIYCLASQNYWNQLNDARAHSLCIDMWQYASEYQPLKQRLFWYLVAFHLEKQQQKLILSLSDTLATFKPQNPRDYVTLKIVDLIARDNYLDLASLCLAQCLLPERLLLQNSLPCQFKSRDKISLVNAIQDRFALALKKIDNLQPPQIDFLIETLTKLSPANQLVAVENLLVQIKPEVASSYPKLVNWVKKNYFVSTDYRLLSDSGRRLFSKWLGAINYRDFTRLIDLLIEKVSIDSLEDRQLTQRKIFWSNYSDRFTRIRFLLPFSTIQALKNDFNLESITQLINDGSYSTEAVIFDFGDRLVIEFLRGKGGEVRIFPKTEKLERELFDPSVDMYLKKIRALPIETTNIFDRCIYWQTEFARFLETQNIFPNDGWEYLQIEANKNGIPYRRYHLPLLNERQRRERQEQLLNWQQNMGKLEHDAHKYSQRKNNLYNSQSVLIFKDNKSLGNQKPSKRDFID